MRRLAALIAASACLAAGCGGEDEPAGTQAATPTPTATPAPAGGNEPEVSTVATGLDVPWELAFLPDGRALVTERPGRIRLLSAEGELRSEPVAEVDVEAAGEGGLLGLAIDPAFEDNQLLYLYRTTGRGNEVVRCSFEGGRLREEAVVVRGIEAAGIHNGGRLRFGPDERLYVSTGDAAQPDLAQEPESLNGKILSLGPELYRRGSDAQPEMFSLGHRNPQGFDWQPGTDRLVSNEHGPDGDDEVNLLRRGGNYGWPLIRGEEREEGLRTPIAVYPDSIAPSGATFLRRQNTPWTGDYFMASLVGNRLQRVTISQDGRVTDQEALFDGEYGRLRTVVEGPDGALYVLTNNTDGRGSPSEGDDRILRIFPPRGR